MHRQPNNNKIVEKITNDNDWINIGSSATVREMLSDFRLNESPNLDDVAKRKYIENFLTKEVSGSLGYADVESVYQRINRIHGLNDITNNPLYLMMTLVVLPTLEYFYADKNIYSPSEVVEKDVMHLFTATIIDMEARKIISDTGITSIGKTAISECIFTFTNLLAKVMDNHGNTLSVISEHELFNIDRKSEALLTLTEQQVNTLKKLFSNDPAHYRNNEEYLKYKIGREGCIFLKRKGSSGEFQYGFIRKEFLDYFSTLIPRVINGRRKEITDYLRRTINNAVESTSVTPSLTSQSTGFFAPASSPKFEKKEKEIDQAKDKIGDQTADNQSLSSIVNNK